MAVVVFLTGVFYVSGLLFLATDTPPSTNTQAVKASTSSEVYPGYFRLLYFLPSFFVTFLPRALRFWVGIFHPQAFFYLALLPQIFWHVFVTQMRAGTLHTGSSYRICACPHRVVHSGWRMDLNYLYCSYKTIDLSMRQRATKYRVKTSLLNIFRLFKVIWKDYKNTLNKTW